MTRRRISRRERAQIFKDNGGRCHICGGRIDVGRERWEVDHRIPLEMGGDEAPGSDNLQPAHVKCHRAPGGKTATDIRHIAKAKRMEAAGMGIKTQPKRPVPGSKADWRARRWNKTEGRWITINRRTGERL